MKKSALTLSLTVLLPILFSACSTTKVVSSWTTSNPPANTFDKILVLAIMTDREVQNRTEHAMTAQLKSHGVNAYSAFDLFGPKRFDGQTEEQILSKLRGSDYTSVMIVSLLDKEKETRYVPGSYSPSYFPYYYPGHMHFYRRYWAVYGSVYSPGYFTTTTKYVLEADIYTVNDDDELVYSAQTRTVDPSDIRDLAMEFAKSIVDELKAKGMIP